MDNDATAAFDRVLPALCVVTCRQLGMPKAAQRFFFRILRQMVYTVTTAHGTSTQTYTASGAGKAPGQGVIQGGGASSPNYSSQQHPVLKAVETNCTPAVFAHALRARKRFKRWATGFADDMSLLLNAMGIQLSSSTSTEAPTPQRVRDALNDNLTRYETYFATVGGSLNLKKCFYYLVDFVWTGTSWRYKTNLEIAVPPVTITPTTLDNTGSPQPIAWLEANDAQRTLGSHIAPDGSGFRQLDILHGHLEAWQKALRNINGGNLQAKWLSYQNVYSKKIMYPLIGHSFTEADLHPIQQPTDRELLHVLGLNEHFRRAVLHASTTFGGMGCPTFHAQHVADKIVLFLHHMKENAEIAEIFKASMSLTQLECGVSKPFFSLPAETWHDLVTPTWLTHIWKECEPKGIEIHFAPDHFWLPSAQRVNDHPLMELAEYLYGNSIHLHNINQCRLALQVTYLSDITSVDGRKILHAYYNGVGHTAAGRYTRLNWPPVGTLPPSHWTLWKDFLNRMCGTSLRLPDPLGGWFTDVDILTRIISQSDQIIVSQPNPTDVQTIQDLYATLPQPLQRLMGHIEWPDEDTTFRLAEAIRQGTAVGVSDGSVRATADLASHAWILQGPDGAEIIGKGPVDGTTRARTSHRAELQGQTGVFLMVALLVQFYGIVRGHFASYCDNAAVVKKLQRGWEMVRLQHTKGADTDLQITLRSIIQNLGPRITYMDKGTPRQRCRHTPLQLPTRSRIEYTHGYCHQRGI